MWRRYRLPMVAALPVGAVIGGAVAVAMYLSGNPDYREYGGVGAFFALVLPALLIGAAVAAAAMIVAVLSVLLYDRRLVHSSDGRAFAAAVGAALGTALLWLGVGVVDAVVTPYAASSGLGYAPLFIVVTAPVSALAAAVSIRLADRRASEAAERPG